MIYTKNNWTNRYVTYATEPIIPKKRHGKKLSVLVTNYFTAALMLAISLTLVIIGAETKGYQISLLGVFLFWSYSMIFGLIAIDELYAYSIMNFLLFVFFLSRPTISLLYKTNGMIWGNIIIKEALLLIFVSEVALFAGAVLVKQDSRADVLQIKKTANYNEMVQRTLLVVVLITAVLCAYSAMRNYFHFASLAYEELYVSSGLHDNVVIRASVTLFPYLVFAYLATIPSKRNSIMILLIYVALGVPMFLLGNRTSIVLRIAFAVVYFFMRDYTTGIYTQRWISRSLRIVFIFFVVGAVGILGALNYYRAGLNPNNETTIPILLDFFYRQGTTFDTICQGLLHQDSIMKLPQNVPYSIGQLYDTVKHSTLSQIILDTGSLGSGNSIKMVLEGNNLAHKLSYVVLGETSYLAGFGRGSSYVLELYYDGGLLLVAVFSLAMGVYLASFNRIIQMGKWFLNTIVLTSLSKVFFMPRASAFDFMTFIFTPHFWLIIFIVVVILSFSNDEMEKNKNT